MLGAREITAEAALRDLAHPEPRVREQAAAALGSAPAADRDEAIAALRRALRDDIGAVRYAAALSLGELQDAGSLEALVDQLEDGDPMAREAAAIALGEIGDQRAFEPLARALASGPPEVRFQAVASLSALNPDRAYELLLRALGDADAEVRASAAAALGDHADPRACDRLAALLDDADRACRFEAAFALARMGDRRATPVLVGFIGDRDHVALRPPGAHAPARRAGPRAVAQRRWASSCAGAGEGARRGGARGARRRQARAVPGRPRRPAPRGRARPGHPGARRDRRRVGARLLRELRSAARDDDQRAMSTTPWRSAARRCAMSTAPGPPVGELKAASEPVASESRGSGGHRSSAAEGEQRTGPPELIDSHCHLGFEDFGDDREAVIERARTAGVAEIVCVGAGQDFDLRRGGARHLPRSRSFIHAVVGIHPHDAARAPAGALAAARGALRRGGGRRASARPASTSTTITRPATRRSASSATSSAWRAG